MVRKILTATFLASTLATGAQASTLLSETFSTATSGLYGVGVIAGTQFEVTNNNVDIIGLPSGSPFSCVHNLSGNCLDLVGSSGAGGIQSTATFNLLAGTTYTVSFGAVLQGFAPGSPAATNYKVSLGSLFNSLSADATGANVSLSFTPLVNESAVRLGFTTLTAPDGVHGVVLDNILLTAAPVPEPAAAFLMLTGLAGLAVRARWSRSKG